MASRFAFFIETNSLHHDKGFAGQGRQSGLLLNQSQKSIREKYNPLIKFCCTLTDPAAKTKSIGLPTDAEPALSVAKGCLVFCSSPRLFYRDTEIFPVYRDLLPSRQIIMTQDLSPIYRDWQKTWHLDTPP